MKKLLTVVICCYNSTKTVLNTLESIEIKTNKDIDVFLIDDGSKDNLQHCVKDYLKQFPDRVHYFRKENGNWGSCVNFAIKKANSRYLSILDADDEYNTKSLESVLQILRQSQIEPDLVLCNYEFHFLNERSTKIKPIYVSLTNELIRYIPYKKLGLSHIITIHSVIFNTKILKGINPLPSKVYYSDSLLIYQALLRARIFAYLNRYVFLYKYHIRRGSQSISIEKSLKNLHHFEVIYDHLLKQPFVVGNKKRLKITKRCLTIHIYWLLRILANDLSKNVKERCKMLRHYIDQYEQCVAKNNCSIRKFHTPLTKIIKHNPKFAMWITKVILNIVKSGFIKATDFSPEAKKEVKAFNKAKRKIWRKEQWERIKNSLK